MPKCSIHVCPPPRNRIGTGTSPQMVVHEAADKSVVDTCYGYTVRCKPIRKVRDAPHVDVDGASCVAGINEIFAVGLSERERTLRHNHA